MKRLTIIVLLSIHSLSLGEGILVKTNPRKYQITVQTTVEHSGIGSSKTDLFLAYLVSNVYQQRFHVKIGTLAKTIPFGNAGDSCIYYNLALGKKLALGKRITLQNEFLLEVNDVYVDLNAIDTIYPYDSSDLNYTKYTGSSYPFINVKQKKLTAISELIWSGSSGIIDYAKNCYLYVAKVFKYGLPLSGFQSLEFILQKKMGDCGNLSSVFITLLRMKGIPARHLIGFRPDGSLHVWADFYLAKYGWIPVDITYKQEYPDGNYFGEIKFENSGFIAQRGIGHGISVLENPMRIAGLQTYSYQTSYSKSQTAKIYIERKVTCKLMRFTQK